MRLCFCGVVVRDSTCQLLKPVHSAVWRPIIFINVNPHTPIHTRAQIDAGSVVLQPGEARDMALTFRPPAPGPYNDVVPLRVNGLYAVNVAVAGEGVPLRLELADPAQRTLAFGAVPRGQMASRTLALVNRSRAPVSVGLAPSRDVLERRCLEAAPAGGLVLRPREEARLSLLFRPNRRMAPFSEELVVDAAGVPLPLAALTGACTAGELMLASDSVPFGTVALGSRATKRLTLSNTGDVGVRFAWDAKALAPHFSVSPPEGFLPPGQDARLEVAFQPTAASADIRVERARCRVDGAPDLALALTLTGACCAATPLPEPVEFRCAVRGRTTRAVVVSNPTAAAWALRPVVQYDYWSGPEVVRVPAGGRAECALTYAPLTMSASGAPHEGSVFLPIPDGSGLLYRLVGTVRGGTGGQGGVEGEGAVIGCCYCWGCKRFAPLTCLLPCWRTG